MMSHAGTKIILNGRFTHQAVAGVQRYSSEIYRRISSEVNIISPTHFGSGLPGHLWEQYVLARKIPKNQILWSPANSGPLNISNQALTIHDIAVLERPSWYRKEFAIWYRFLLSKLVHNVKIILTVSNFSKERITSHFGLAPEKVVVIPNGVGAPFQNLKEQPPTLNINLPEKYLLAVGTIQPRKNLPLLIQAWQVIKKRYPDYALVIVGKSNKVFRKVELSKSDRQIQIIPYADDPTLAEIYRRAAALIFPSYYEGFGLPALEAMACGTPVIAANNSALPEVVGQAGLYFDPHSLDELIEQIETFLGDESIQNTLASQALLQAKKFNWDRTSREVLQVLRAAADADE